ncbi:MAG TPA: metal-dependent transcriptional regulator [Firmicutes bacterium]|nr:metal-dependent transcriptional regulator [Bacillota bacterium]
MKNVLTPSLEDYLEELYRLSRRGGGVKAKELAARLNVSLPSVTRALQKLSKTGHVTYRAYEEATLTPQGREVGRYLVRRNTVLRRFVEALGVGCDAAEEVEFMEHYLSPEIVFGIERLLGYLEREKGGQPLRRLIAQGQLRKVPPAVRALDEAKHLRRFGGKGAQTPMAVSGGAQTPKTIS